MTTVAECSRIKCEHWESENMSLRGHCSHASCPNYLQACPRHQTAAARPGETGGQA